MTTGKAILYLYSFISVFEGESPYLSIENNDHCALNIFEVTIVNVNVRCDGGGGRVWAEQRRVCDDPLMVLESLVLADARSMSSSPDTHNDDILWSLII